MLRQILVQKGVFQMPRREERLLLARDLERSPVPVERENQE